MSTVSQLMDEYDQQHKQRLAKFYARLQSK